MSRTLDRALQRFRSRRADGVPADLATRVSGAAFRAAMEERMRNLERDLGDIKSRVNGLIFLVVGAVITQLLVRVPAW